jgi:hypothetical protein
MLIDVDHLQLMAPQQLLVADKPDILNGAQRIGGGAGNKQPQDVMLILGLGAWFLVLQVHR